MATAKRLFEYTTADAPPVTLGRLTSPDQRAMNDMYAPLGKMGDPHDNLLNFSGGYPLGSQAMPAGSMAGVANPRVDAAALTIEMKTVFAAQESELAAMLGSVGICPLQLTDRSSFVVQQMQFNSLLPNARPLRGRVSMGTYNRSQRTATLAPFGVGMEMPIRFYLDPDGPQIYRGALEQIRLGVIDFMLLLAYNLLESARDYGAEVWRQTVETASAGNPGSLPASKWFERENRFLGLIQRNDRPIEALMLFVREQQQLIQTSSNAAVVAQRIADYMHNVRGYTEYFRAGASGPALVAGGGEAALSQKLGLRLHFVRPGLIDDEQPFDFMSGWCRYGEVVRMPCRLDQHTDSEPYRTQWDSVMLYDGDADRWCEITKEEALRNSGRWDIDNGGRLRDVFDNRIGADWADGNHQATQDWLHKDGSPITNWLQLDDQYLRPQEKAVLSTITGVRLTGSAGTGDMFAEIGAEQDELIGADLTGKQGKRLVAAILREPYTVAVDAWVARYFDENTENTVPARLPYPMPKGALALLMSRSGLKTLKEGSNTAAVLNAIDNSPSILRALQALETADLPKALPPIYRPVISASSSSSSSAMPELQFSGADASGISKKAQQNVESALLGRWAYDARSGTLTAQSGAGDAKLSTLGLLKQRDGKLDRAAGDQNAATLLSWVPNYTYNNAADAEGVRNTDIVRAHLLSAAAAINTDGTADQVAARIGAFVQWAANNRYASAEPLRAPLTTPRTAADVTNVARALNEFASSADGKAVFNDGAVATALRSVTSTAARRDAAAVGAALQSSQRVGAPPSSDYDYTPSNLVWSSFQAQGYADLYLNTPTRVQAVFLRRYVGEAADTSDMLPTLLREGRVTMSPTASGSPTSSTQPLITSGGPLSTDWANVLAALQANIPVPVTVLLMRPNILLRTSGMIFTQTGAQNLYYAKPIMTATTDDAHQVERATLSFEAGGLIVRDKPTYHARNLLITGSFGGFNCEFHQGGQGDKNTYLQALNDPMSDSQRPSIIAVVEPMHFPEQPHGMPSPMTAYGSWDQAPGLPFMPRDSKKRHFASVDFVRKWFGVSPTTLQNMSEAMAAYAGNEPRSDSLAMWHGAYRPYSIRDRTFAESVVKGTGPIAMHPFYGPGMTTAWREGTAYPAQSTVAALVM